MCHTKPFRRKRRKESWGCTLSSALLLALISRLLGFLSMRKAQTIESINCLDCSFLPLCRRQVVLVFTLECYCKNDRYLSISREDMSSMTEPKNTHGALSMKRASGNRREKNPLYRCHFIRRTYVIRDVERVRYTEKSICTESPFYRRCTV